MRRLGSLFLLLLAEVGVASPASEPSTGAHHNRVFFGAMSKYAHPIAAEGAHSVDMAGGGVLVGYAPLPDALELEFDVAWLSDADAGCIPMDVLVKGVHHFGPVVEPFVGFGPMVLVDLGRHRAPTTPGVASTLGTNAWMTHHVGLFAEANYHHLFAQHPVDEVGAHVGVVLGF